MKIYCKFTIESAYEIILKSINVGEVTGKKVIVSRALRLGTILLKDE